MLRYVRTKDTEYGAIIDTKKYKEITGEDCYIPKDEIVEQADTIEELCDEFVVKAYCRKEPILFTKEQMDIKVFAKNCDKDTIIYGAIWTDKGLQFVARLNSKGELELL